MEEGAISEDRLEELLADASEFFADHLWETDTGRAARDALAAQGLEEKIVRAFGVGPPVGGGLRARSRR